jgi:hypothetical protein
MAAIETAKQISAMYIAKARNAAVSGDKETLEAELKAATEIWPRNPALTEVSNVIYSQADVQFHPDRPASALPTRYRRSYWILECG